MPPPAGTIKHLVVLMLENRSFDHMLGFLKSDTYPIDGLNGDRERVVADLDCTPVNAIVFTLKKKASVSNRLSPAATTTCPAANRQVCSGAGSATQAQAAAASVNSKLQTNTHRCAACTCGMPALPSTTRKIQRPR